MQNGCDEDWKLVIGMVMKPNSIGSFLAQWVSYPVDLIQNGSTIYVSSVGLSE